MIRKRFQLNWMFECPEAVLTCSILRCHEKNYLVFGGHDKTLYLMDESMNILDDRVFDGWCRCSYAIDLDEDGCDEILVGAGDGHFMVLKLNIEKRKLIGIMGYRSSKKIDCCIAGDLSRNGKMDLIIGGEDKTLKIFESYQSKEPKFILYYDSWVTAITLGYLKLPDNNETIYGLLVGTKNGLIQLIQIVDDVPDILWQKDFHSQINDIEVGDVTNDGLNEVILSSDDSTIKILNSEGVLLKAIEVEEGRPLSILIEDIDGDNANEIVIGCADGTLRVYHNPSLNSTDFELKWKTKVSTSIQDVQCLMGKEQNLKHIVFGGYDRAIRNLTDFEWGEKPALNIPSQIEIPEKIPVKEEPLDEEIKIEEVPTNIRDHIFKILKEKETFKSLVKDLSNLGYTRSEILEEIEIMRTQKIISYQKITYPIYVLLDEQIPEDKEVEKPTEQPKVLVEPVVIEESTRTEKEKLIDALDLYSEEEKEVGLQVETQPSSELKDIIVEYLTQHELVGTKTELMNEIAKKGFSKDEIETEIDSLKLDGIITYLRGKTQGWSLTNK
jgi:WD40 repeat protein